MPHQISIFYHGAIALLSDSVIVPFNSGISTESVFTSCFSPLTGEVENDVSSLLQAVSQQMKKIPRAKQIVIEVRFKKQKWSSGEVSPPETDQPNKKHVRISLFLKAIPYNLW